MRGARPGLANLLGRYGTGLLFIGLCLVALSTFLTYYCLVARRDVCDHGPWEIGTGESGSLHRDACSCMHCHQWPEEERRVFRSVRQEHLQLLKEFKEMKAKLEEISKSIPLKEAELAELDLKINELKTVQKEFNDKRNVRLALPDPPLFPPSHDVRPEIIASPSGGIFTYLEESIDYKRCSISTQFPVYLYELGVATTSLHDELAKQPYINTDPHNACIFVMVYHTLPDAQRLPHWSNEGRNQLIIVPEPNEPVDTRHFKAAMVVAPQFERGSFRAGMDIALHLTAPAYDLLEWQRLPQLMTDPKKYFLSYMANSTVGIDESGQNQLKTSMRNSQDSFFIDSSCTPSTPEGFCFSESARMEILRQSSFALLPFDAPSFQKKFYETLLAGAIPVVLYARGSDLQQLPFSDLLDWRLASVALVKSRLPELHYVLRSISTADMLEMRRKGRFYLENYLLNTKVLARAILAAVRYRLHVPGRGDADEVSTPLFSTVNGASFEPPNPFPLTYPTRPPFDDEYLGPVEVPTDSQFYTHNLTSLSLFAYKIWNELPYNIENGPAAIAQDFAMPSGAEFNDALSFGMRPISPGSGQEFSQALGGNRPREQFTIVMLTYNRDSVLSASLERLHMLPYLNRVVVVWNNVQREPPGSWPKLHVPIVFIRVAKNSLNNRFIPYDQIKTEAVLSMDDDMDLKQHEIVFAFRYGGKLMRVQAFSNMPSAFSAWREQRHRIVGFPARYHARYGDELFYNSNHTCQLSMVLTGAAFIHRSYFHAYTHYMPEMIRMKVDEWTNCEDLAMNFLVSHITRQPPIKTTSKWTLRCPTCPEELYAQEDHFNERHQCIRFFIEVYGYNPLLYSQFRVDSVLFKTRVPLNHQKCFRFV